MSETESDSKVTSWSPWRSTLVVWSLPALCCPDLKKHTCPWLTTYIVLHLYRLVVQRSVCSGYMIGVGVGALRGDLSLLPDLGPSCCGVGAHVLHWLECEWVECGACHLKGGVLVCISTTGVDAVCDPEPQWALGKAGQLALLCTVVSWSSRRDSVNAGFLFVLESRAVVTEFLLPFESALFRTCDCMLIWPCWHIFEVVICWSIVWVCKLRPKGV